MNDTAERSLAQDIALFLLLVVLVPLAFPAERVTSNLTATFYLSLFIHVGFSIYLGGFTGWRKMTWSLLILLWAGSELSSFLGWTMVWGQWQFWLASRFPFIGDLTGIWSNGGANLSVVLALTILIADAAIMHHAIFHGRSLKAMTIFLAAVVLTAFLATTGLGWVAGHLFKIMEVPASDTLEIVSPWYLLPFYALLRAVENKLGGMTLMFGAMFAPLLAPWLHGERLRRGPLQLLWLAACLLLGAAWIGLGYLGSLSVDDAASVYGAPLLAVIYFGFFLSVPVMLVRTSRTTALM